MTTSTTGRPDQAADPIGEEPIPPMPLGAVIAASRHYRQISGGLPALLRGVRDRNVRAGDVETYARLCHALSHVRPETACRIAAAAVLQLSQRAA